MSTKIKTVKLPIPTGWERIEGATKLSYEDRVVDLEWKPPEFPVTGYCVNDRPSTHIYIRRIPKKRKKA